MNPGREIEDIVEELCVRSFSADFTFRSPEYQKQDGQRKEAVDFLIVLGHTLIAIQVKSKELDFGDGVLSPVQQQRLGASVDKATQQFHALIEAADNPTFRSFKNSRGRLVDFEKERIKEFMLIIVVAPLWKSEPENGAILRFKKTCLPYEIGAFHLFTLQQFEMLLCAMDTLPDFSHFLNVRWCLHLHELVHPGTDPVDEWAFSALDKTTLAQVLTKREAVDITAYAEKHGDSIRELEEKEKPSYIIDRLIEGLNAGIDHPVPVQRELAKLSHKIATPNSEHAFRLTVPYLAKLNRNERRELAERFLVCVGRCKEQPVSFSGMKFQDHEEAYLVLAATLDVYQRQIAVYNIGLALGQKLKVKTVVCISGFAEEPVVSPTEAIVIDVANMKLNERVIKASEEIFAPSFEHRI